MRRDPAFRECRATPRREAHVARQPEIYADPGQRAAVAIGEQRLTGLELMSPTPLLNEAASLRPKWHRARLPTFAEEVDDLAVRIGNFQLRISDTRAPVL